MDDKKVTENAVGIKASIKRFNQFLKGKTRVSEDELKQVRQFAFSITSEVHQVEQNIELQKVLIS